MKKLHLGCGNKRLEGYVNVDIRPDSAVDLVSDLRSLPFQPHEFDLIYSCAVIEHFGRKEWFDLLKTWTTFLKPGGKIYLSTSDFDAIANQYQKTKNLEELLGLLIGGQKYEYDWHGMVFNFSLLKKALEELGYHTVERYDWREFDIGKLGVDDYSQAYLPHMDKDNGTLMVLNICGTKG
jgi:predicted SAM-dependent methyltransferase